MEIMKDSTAEGYEVITHRSHVFDQFDDNLSYLWWSWALHPPVTLSTSYVTAQKHIEA